MSTRDLANKRISLYLGNSTSVADLSQPTVAECAAMLPAHRAVRWDGFDFGMQASDQIDDRTLDDDASAQLRGFMQFGGGLPLFYPKASDTTSILRQVYNLVKSGRPELIVVERVGFVNTSVAITAGDNVNSYRVIADGFKPDTEGTGGYAYLLNLKPKGDVWPWTIVPAVSPAAVAIVGGLTLALAVGAVGLRGATYQGNNVANRVTWASSDPTKATVDNHGVITGIATGTATITATFPGGTASTGCVVTVS